MKTGKQNEAKRQLSSYGSDGESSVRKELERLESSYGESSAP
jgi:hypothetical protein